MNLKNLLQFSHQSKSINYTDIINEYSKIMQDQSHIVRRESELPASKEVIILALEQAKTDPIYKTGEDAINFGIVYLNNFVPDSDYDHVTLQINKIMTMLEARDNDGYKIALHQLPERYHNIIKNMIVAFYMNHQRPGSE